MAVDEYKRINGRPFPSWSEIFEIVQYLGYRKVADRAGHINTASGAEVLQSEAGAAEAEAKAEAEAEAASTKYADATPTE